MELNGPNCLLWLLLNVACCHSPFPCAAMKSEQISSFAMSLQFQFYLFVYCGLKKNWDLGSGERAHNYTTNKDKTVQS